MSVCRHMTCDRPAGHHHPQLCLRHMADLRWVNECAVDECTRTIRAGGMCLAHYDRARRPPADPAAPISHHVYPPAPLLDVLDARYPTWTAAAHACRVSGSTIDGWRAGRRLTEHVADRIACDLGMTIRCIWGGYIEEAA